LQGCKLRGEEGRCRIFSSEGVYIRLSEPHELFLVNEKGQDIDWEKAAELGHGLRLARAIWDGRLAGSWRLKRERHVGESKVDDG